MTGRKPASAPAKWDRYLTRYEASDMLGCSIMTIKAWVRKDFIKEYHGPHPDSRGNIKVQALYDPTELAKMPRRMRTPARDQGESAARAFEMFETGTPIREVVMGVRELPGRVNEWFAEWSKGGGAAITVDEAVREQLRPLIGPFEDAQGLVAGVRALAAELAGAKKQLAALAAK